MAMFMDGLPCPLCGKPMFDGPDLMGTTFVGMATPEFRCLDDAVFHRACLMAWEHRDHFIAEWNPHWPWLIGFPEWRIYLINGMPVNGFELSLWSRLKAEFSQQS